MHGGTQRSDVFATPDFGRELDAVGEFVRVWRGHRWEGAEVVSEAADGLGAVVFAVAVLVEKFGLSGSKVGQVLFPCRGDGTIVVAVNEGLATGGEEVSIDIKEKEVG